MFVQQALKWRHHPSPQVSLIVANLGYDVSNREFKKTTRARTTGTLLKKSFNKQNNGCARALKLSILICRPLQKEKPTTNGDKGERRWLIFKIYFPYLTLCSIFNFEIVLTVKKKLMTLGSREIRR